jgi:hypothetical protein
MVSGMAYYVSRPPPPHPRRPAHSAIGAGCRRLARPIWRPVSVQVDRDQARRHRAHRSCRSCITAHFHSTDEQGFAADHHGHLGNAQAQLEPSLAESGGSHVLGRSSSRISTPTIDRCPQLVHLDRISLTNSGASTSNVRYSVQTGPPTLAAAEASVCCTIIRIFIARSFL